MRRLRTLAVAGMLLTTILPQPTLGWSECGHHLVALLAFDLLHEGERRELLELLAAHPRYSEDFVPPEGLTDPGRVARWRVGRAGYWPDVARGQPKYDRPTWHYELAATRTIGNDASMSLPMAPGPLPPSATLETRELHIAQAVRLCQRVLGDRRQPLSDRAIALTWLAHLVGDAHQPCHAGSLYVEGVFPEGDRGANSIPVKQGRNMHAVWDGLLGGRYDGGDIQRRLVEIKSSQQLMRRGRDATAKRDGLDPQTWLAESRRAALVFVYTPEVTAPISAAARGLTSEVRQINLSEAYLKRAGQLSRMRATEAAHRLAGIWRLGLRDRQ